MPKEPSPLLGYNNNIRHRNRVFHVQTEDSGVKHPHIITHLFMDGGRILKSIKKSYAEYLGVDKMADVVRQMMKEQHKGMLIALRDGQFDQILEDADGKTANAAPQSGPAKSASRPAEHPPPMQKKASMPPPADVTRGEDASKSAARSPSARPPSVHPGRVGATPKPPPPARPPSWRPPSAPPPARSPSGLPPRLAPGDEAPPTARMAPEAIAAEIGADETMDDLEPAFEPQNDLPPPPANLFRPKEPGSAGGGYRTLTPVPEESLHRRSSKAPPPSTRSPRVPPQPPSKGPGRQTGKPGESPKPAPAVSGKSTGAPGRAPPPPQAQASSRAPTGARPQPPNASPRQTADPRYAPARPAAIFGQGARRGSSIFGEDLISDKSLDEVILSYLAEDLESPPADPKKKR